MTNAWVVRAGSHGECEDFNLDRGRATIGWPEIGDLSGHRSKATLRQLVDDTFRGAPAMRRANYTGQLWAFRDSIQPGDLVVMPLKTRPGYLAFGRCSGSYGYDPGSERDRRHFLPVQWQAEQLSRTVLKDDLLATVNGAMTVFSPSKNNAAARLEAVARDGVDPGNNGQVVPPPATDLGGHSDTGSGVTDPAPAPTLDAIQDRIRTHIVENFGEHKMTRLVAALLEAQGFVCDVSPEGPDGGVDILASSGPLGFGSPTIVVEVKSEPTPVGSQVLRTLHSAVTRYGADHGLLVAWGGVNKVARNEFQHLRKLIRIWDAEDLLEHLFESYSRLPDHVRAALPLKQAWVLDDDSGA